MSLKNYPLPLLKHGCLALALLALPLPMVQSVRATEQINSVPVTTDIHSALQDVGSFYFGLYGITVSLENNQGFTPIPRNNLPAYQPFQILAEAVGEAMPTLKQSENTSDVNVLIPDVNVLIAEVVVTGSDGQPIDPGLERRVYEAITTEPGSTSTRSQLQQDINNIFATGFFANVRAVPEDTPLGVRVTFVAQPNPALARVEVTGNNVLPQSVVDRIFSPQYGRVINLVEFQNRILALNEWYQENGYVLAQVITAPQVGADGVVTLVVAEGVIESIQVRYRNEEGLSEDEDGNPIQGETQEFVITREIHTQPGDVFQQLQIQTDLQRVFGLGIFDDVNLTLNPGERDPRKVTMVINLVERNTYYTVAGVGSNFTGDIFINQEYKEDNLRGLAQALDISFQIGTGRNNEIKGSLKSPGSRNGLPMQRSIFEDDLNFRDHAYQAYNVSEPLSFEQSLESLDKLIDIAKSMNQDVLLVLLLNNSGKTRQTYITPVSQAPSIPNTNSSNASEPFYVHSELNFVPAATTALEVERSARLVIDSYTEAQEILQLVNSPVLETIISLNKAQTHRRIGELDASLQGHFQAIDSLRTISSDMSFEQLLGDQIYEFLREEWLLDQVWDEDSSAYDPDPDFHEYLNVAIPLVELFMLFDVISIYSESGDYQSAIYASRFPRLKDLNGSSISGLSELLTRASEARLLEDQSNSGEFAAAWLSSWGSSSQVTLNLLPEIYPLRSLELVFSDLDDQERSEKYDQEIKYVSQQQQRQTNTFVYSVLEAVLSNPSFISSSNSQGVAEIFDEIRQALPNLFDPSTSSWNRNELQALADRLVNPVIDLAENSFEGIESYRGWLTSLPPLIIEYLFADAADNASPVQAEERAIRFYQTLLEDWPTDNGSEFVSQLEVLKGYVLKLKADSHYRLGDHELAIQNYTESLRLLEKEKDQVNQFLEVFLPSQRFDAMLNVADTYLKLQNLKEARNWYESASKLIEAENSSNQLFSRQSDYPEVFYGLATVDLLSNDFESAQANIEQALIRNREFLPRVLSAYRKGAVDLTLQYGYGIPRQGLVSANFSTPWNLSKTADSRDTSPWNQSFQNRCDKIASHTRCRQTYFELYVRLLMTQHQNNPSQGFDVLALEIAEQARISDYESLQSRLSPSSSSQYLSQRRESLGVAKSFRAIQAEIPDDETLVLSYFLGEESSYLWLISKTGLQTYTLPSRDAIEAQAQEFYDLLTSPPGRVRPRTTAAAGQQLSDMILKPVADQLGQKRLVIVGDGFLQYLPFGALPNPAPAATPSAAALEGEFAPALNPLILEHEVVYLPSASALVGLRENRNSRPLPQQELAFFANPVFSHRDERVDSVRLAEGWEPFSPEELANVEVIYSQLPETERELEAVLASGLIPDTQVQKFWGYDANLEAALSPELGQHRIVHFASHGIFNSNAPDRSGVVLSGISEAGVVQSGLLSPRHAFNQMNLSATDLVILSGCRTGLSEGLIGREGVTGLTSGLMSAGADRVVASLWSVRDDATQELMQRFYAGMLDPENPMTPAAALRAAQISMWEEARWQAPYYWAAFTLQGEWE